MPTWAICVTCLFAGAAGLVLLSVAAILVMDRASRWTHRPQ